MEAHDLEAKARELNVRAAGNAIGTLQDLRLELKQLPRHPGQVHLQNPDNLGSLGLSGEAARNFSSTSGLRMLRGRTNSGMEWRSLWRRVATYPRSMCSCQRCDCSTTTLGLSTPSARCACGTTRTESVARTTCPGRFRSNWCVRVFSSFLARRSRSAKSSTNPFSKTSTRCCRSTNMSKATVPRNRSLHRLTLVSLFVRDAQSSSPPQQPARRGDSWTCLFATTSFSRRCMPGSCQNMALRTSVLSWGAGRGRALMSSCVNPMATGSTRSRPQGHHEPAFEKPSGSC